MASKNPIVSVVSIAQDYLRRDCTDHLLAQSLEFMDRASGCKPDIVSLPETSFQSPPERAPEIIAKLGKWAAQNNSYVIASLLINVDGLTHKSAVLLDRQGSLAGRYDKIHLTEGEVDEGICPGKTDPPVFDTDFGKIGIQICFDCNWPETWNRLAMKGAKMVFFCSAYPAHTHMSAYSWQNEFFIVSSIKQRPSRIYDISGNVLDKSGLFRPWAHAMVPIGKRLFEIDFHVKKFREIELKYGPRIQAQWLHENDWVTLASLDPDLTVDEIMDEFELTALCEYQDRAKKFHDQARENLLGTQAHEPQN